MLKDMGLVIDAQNLLNIIEDNDLALFVKDRNQRYLYINEPGAAMLGRKAGNVIGRTDAELFEHASATLMRERDNFILSSGSPHEYDSLARVDEGWMLFHSVKIRMPSAHSHLFGISANITALRDRLKLDVCHIAFDLMKKNGPAFAAQLTNLQARLLIPT